MTFLEKDLEQIIWESDNLKLQEKRLPIVGKKYRQLRIGNYGILDLMTVEKEYYWDEDRNSNLPILKITVYELKKEKVGISAFLQSLRYCKGIKSYLQKYKPNIVFELNVVLIAKEVDLSGDFIFITDLFDVEYSNTPEVINSVKFYSFDFDINGITFKNHYGYDLTDKGF